MLTHIKEWVSSTNESRKYMDLIFEGASMWPNLEPTSPLQAGDYGSVKKRTGTFEVEGNIYKMGYAKQCGIEEAVTRPQNDQIILTSKDGKYNSPAVNLGPNIPGVASLQLQLDVAFSNSRSALLLLVRPTLVEIPSPGSLIRLHTIPELRGKALVDRVYSCPAYVQVLTRSKDSRVNIGVAAQAITPAGPVGGGFKWDWNVQTSSGIAKYASHVDNVCFPLYQLRTVENRRSISRSASPIPGSSSDESKSPSGGLGDELAPRVYEPPWGELDDDGEEVFWDGDDEEEE